MRKVAAAFAVLFVVACFPARHELEGKACNDVHPCPANLFCVDLTCVSTAPLEDSGNPDGGEWVARIVALHLINAATAQPLYPFVPLRDGHQIPRSVIGNRGVSILAYTEPEFVTAVDFSLIGPGGQVRRENAHPYYFLGDTPADGGVTGWRPDAGAYLLQVTPFLGLETGQTASVTFSVTP